MSYVHGVTVGFQDAPAPAVRAADLSVIGLVGIAYQGAANEPVLIRSRGEGIAAFGADGPLPAALGAIYDQGRPLVVAVNLLDPAADAVQVDDEAVVDKQGVVTLAHGRVSAVTVQNTSKSKTYAVDVDYTLDPLKGAIARISTSNSTWALAANLKVSYKWLDASQVTAADAIGSAAGNAYTGMFALLGAEAATRYRPRILCAPGWTHAQATAAGMLPVADRLRATLVADGPSTSDADAVTYRQAFDSRRVYIVDPRFRVPSGSGTALEWPSARAAGVIAATTARDGFWRSPSNRAIAGVLGTERPVDYSSDPASRANHLNGNQIATAIRPDQGGFRLWGNQVPSSDARWKFLATARTADAIEDSLERSFLWALDRGIDATFFDEVSEAVNAYIRELAGRGAILGGSCSPSDPALNSKQAIQSGESYFDLEFTPVVPSDKIGFRVAITTERYAQLTEG